MDARFVLVIRVIFKLSLNQIVSRILTKGTPRSATPRSASVRLRRGGPITRLASIQMTKALNIIGIFILKCIFILFFIYTAIISNK